MEINLCRQLNEQYVDCGQMWVYARFWRDLINSIRMSGKSCIKFILLSG